MGRKQPVGPRSTSPWRAAHAAANVCVRASSVDAYSNGFHVVLVEECCFDRSMLSHKVNLFDLHHKYADVMKVEEVVAELGTVEVPGQ